MRRGLAAVSLVCWPPESRIERRSSGRASYVVDFAIIYLCPDVDDGVQLPH